MYTKSATLEPECAVRYWRPAVRWLLVLAAAVLTGCTSVKFEGADVSVRLTPDQVLAAGGRQGGTVIWGGRILAVDNYADGTELQVLALPLSSGNVPRVKASSQGRFVAYYPGFLEPVDYAPGRYVSLAGELQGLVEGQVGDRPVKFPLVQSSQIHLWPADVNQWNPVWHIGVGVGIRL